MPVTRGPRARRTPGPSPGQPGSRLGDPDMRQTVAPAATPRALPASARLTAAVVALAAGLLAAGPAAAQGGAVKRTEGRYFVQLSEILLSSEDFDVAMGTFDEGGPGRGAEVERLDAIVSDDTWSNPSVTIGLNRPSGKTAMSITYLAFSISDGRQRQDITIPDNVAHSLLIPPGVVFMRQEPGAPNWANEIVYNRSIDFKLGDFTVEKNIFENERFRLRWLGGLRYAQLRQGLSHFVSFAPEVGTYFGTEAELQDFYTMSSLVSTHGFGPKAGLAARWLLDKEKKRWSIEGALDLAIIPESARVTYDVSMVDNGLFDPLDPNEREIGSPVMPGLERNGAPFRAGVEHDGYTQTTWMAQGRLGFRFKPKSFFAVGLDVWQLRWHDVLSQIGAISDVHELATYEQIIPTGDPLPSDPQLRDAESVIHVPRFARREDFVFEGVSINLLFDF